VNAVAFPESARKSHAFQVDQVCLESARSATEQQMARLQVTVHHAAAVQLDCEARDCLDDLLVASVFRAAAIRRLEML